MDMKISKKNSLKPKVLFIFLFLVFILSSFSVLAFSKKALIIGDDRNLGGGYTSENHENEVRGYFLLTAPEQWEGDICITDRTPTYATNYSGNVTTYQNGIFGCVNYAINNDYSMIIRSYGGAYLDKSSWDLAVENNVLVFLAHGSNNFEELIYPLRLYSGISVSGGNASVERGYGKGLEFFDITPDGITLISFTTPTVAGKGAQIMEDNPNYNIWDVRQHLRQISSFYDLEGNTGNWTKEGGYGKPDINIEIEELELAAPLEITYSIIYVNESVKFKWERFYQTNESGIRIYYKLNDLENESMIYEGNDEEFTWKYNPYGNFTFYIRSYSDVTQKESRDESYSTINLNLKPTPYEINTIEDLDEVRENLDAYYVLNKNLDFNNPYSYRDPSNMNEFTSGSGFAPIGTSPSFIFNGIFDGKNFTISNLFINRSTETYIGLFGFTSANSEIKNVGLINISVNGNLYVGGLVGKNRGLIKDSHTTGSVLGKSYVGGVVGHNDRTSIKNSYSEANVNGRNSVGGLVGYNDGYGAGIFKSYARGNVSGEYSVGGLAGSLTNSGTYISQSYSSGNVNGSGSVGGLVGTTGSDSGVYHSYSTGKVSGFEEVGGLVGNGMGGVIYSFWDINTSGRINSSKGIGKTTIEMKALETFSNPNWSIISVDFDEKDESFTWNIIDGETYPFLSWESERPFPEIINPIIGNSNRPSRVCKINQNQLTRGYTYSFSGGEKCTFSIMEIEYSLVLDSFNLTNAKIIIEENEIRSLLSMNHGKSFDLNNDGVNDLLIMYNEVAKEEAIIFMQGLFNYDGEFLGKKDDKRKNEE